MADLGTIAPNADPTNVGQDWVDGTTTSYTGTTTKDDSADVGCDTNSNADERTGFALANMPADFVSMDSVSVNIRYRVTGSQTNTRHLDARIETDESENSNLADDGAGGFVRIASTVTNTTLQDSGATALTIQATPNNKTNWDLAVIVLSANITKSMGGDTNGLRVDWIEITGTYTASGPAGPAVPPLLSRRFIIRI